MDYGLFYGIGGALIGALLGWLIAGVRQHQRHLAQEAERISLEQGCRQPARRWPTNNMPDARPSSRCATANGSSANSTAGWPPPRSV
ncbi:hypothetical protein SODG_003039 [Sodalis praecaptivus]